MGRIDNLIKMNCPNGVPFKFLREIGDIERGSGLQKKDFVDSGCPCIHYGQLYTKYSICASEVVSFVSEELASSLKKVNPGDILFAVTSENIEDVCKCIAWVGHYPIVTGGHTAIFRHNQNAMYLSYVFQTEFFQSQKRKIAHGTKVIEVTPSDLLDIIIPIPPLEIQEEIVRILNTFTELTAELTAELTDREKQFEFYSSQLLSFDNTKSRKKEKNEVGCLRHIYSLYDTMDSCRNIEFVKLSECCVLERGISPIQKTPPGPYPLVVTTASRKTSVDYQFDKPSVCIPLVSSRGHGVATLNQVYYQEGKFALGNILCCVTPINGLLSAKYLYYYLNNKKNSLLVPLMRGGANVSLTVESLKQVKIPKPPIDLQLEIVRILDTFANYNTELTAELAARKKQQEYYRDILLSFKDGLYERINSSVV